MAGGGSQELAGGGYKSRESRKQRSEQGEAREGKVEVADGRSRAT